MATNSNRRIFWITGFDNSLKTVTVDVAPTGITSSAWTIGGRFVLTNASQEGALRAGDVLIFNNSPASQATASWTFRTAGDVATGPATIRGKIGVRPALTTSGNGVGVCIANVAYAWIENLELKSTAVSGTAAVLSSSGSNGTLYNNKISQGLGNAFTITGNAWRVIANEITGCAGDGINTGNITIVFGNYIHDNSGDGLEQTGNGISMTVVNNVFDSNGGRGVYFSGAPATGTAVIALIEGNTFYANGNSGFEVADADYPISLLNNIIVNSSGQSTVKWAAGSAELGSFHAWNCFYDVAGGGTGAVSGLTVNAQVAGSEIVTDPLLTNPSGGDFSITINSPAYSIGYPGQLLGANLGHMDLGAVQAQGPTIIINTTL